MTGNVRVNLQLRKNAPACCWQAMPPKPPAGLGPITKHGNSRGCRNDAEHVQMVWRSSPSRRAPDRNAACSQPGGRPAVDEGLRISALIAEPGTPSEDAPNLLVSWAATLDQAGAAHATAGLNPRGRAWPPVPVTARGSSVMAPCHARSPVRQVRGRGTQKADSPGASDKPSDNAARRRQTQRDVPRQRYQSDLQQADPVRRRRTQPPCMVRRRSTVRFRNGAPLRSSRLTCAYVHV